MKNLKKTFAIVLTVAMLVTLFMVPVAAEEMTAAEKLEAMEILVGAGSGVDADYLAMPATKITAAILLLKLKGMIADAEAWNGTGNFDDVDMAKSLYAKTIMGYLFETPGAGFVGYNGMLDPNVTITAQMYYKVLLTALGYEQGVDFEWAGVLTFAASMGLTEIAAVGELTINDFAIATVEALDVEVKGTGMTLIEKLVDDGVVSMEAAEAAGWSFVAEIASAVQTGAKEITVTFTNAVDSATVKLKDGIFTKYTTAAWSEDMMTLTLTTLTDLTNAKVYTVEVTTADGMLTADVTAYAPVANGIMITTNELRDATTDVVFSVVDQYGDDMGIAGTALTTGIAVIVTDADTGVGHAAGSIAFAAQATSMFKLTAADTGVGDLVRITLVYNAMVVTKDFVVVSDASPLTSSISFGEVAPLEGDTVIFEGNAANDYFIPYALIDQYGDPATLVTGNYTWVSSNTAVVNPATFAVNGLDKLTFDTGAAGTAVITVIAGADLVGQISITVSADSTATAADISSPTVLVAAGEEVMLDLVVVDQYDDVLVNSTAGLTIVGTNCTAALDGEKIKVTATTVGTNKVEVKNGATVIGTIEFEVYAAAVATTVTGATFPTLFMVGATKTIASADVTVLDQYDRAFTGGTVTLVDGADASFTTAGLVITAVSAGNDTVTVQVDGTTNVFAVPVECVAAVDVTTYMLTSDKATIYTSATADYHATLTLIGKTAGGDEVVLTGLPTAVTSSNVAIAKITAGKVEGVAAGTATIYAWNGGTLLATTTITVTDAAPVAMSIAFSATTIANGNNIDTILDVIDQYGVDIAATAVIAVATSAPTVIDAAGDALIAGTATVTVVSGGVMSPTTVITVT
jgi:hypothetical protein